MYQPGGYCDTVRPWHQQRMDDAIQKAASSNSSTGSNVSEEWSEKLHRYVMLADHQTYEQEINAFTFYWMVGAAMKPEQMKDFCKGLAPILMGGMKDLLGEGSYQTDEDESDDESDNKAKAKEERGRKVDNQDNDNEEGSEEGENDDEDDGSGDDDDGDDDDSNMEIENDKKDDGDDDIDGCKFIKPFMPETLRYMAVSALEELDFDDARLYCQIATKLDYCLTTGDVGSYCQYVEQEKNPSSTTSSKKEINDLIEYFEQVIQIHSNGGLLDYLISRMSSSCSDEKEIIQDLIDYGDQCLVCGNQEKKLLNCSRCKGVYYCSRTCQKKNWKSHKKLCNRIVQAKNRIDKLLK